MQDSSAKAMWKKPQPKTKPKILHMNAMYKVLFHSWLVVTFQERLTWRTFVAVMLIYGSTTLFLSMFCFFREDVKAFYLQTWLWEKTNIPILHSFYFSLLLSKPETLVYRTVTVGKILRSATLCCQLSFHISSINYFVKFKVSACRL